MKTKVGPTAGILALLKRRKNGATKAEIVAAFPKTKKSDITTRLVRRGLIVRVEPGRYAIKGTRYPKSLSTKERQAAAKAIREQLRGKTGHKRAETRALAMDSGPSDDEGGSND
jgi:hypothetical protein